MNVPVKISNIITFLQFLLMLAGLFVNMASLRMKGMHISIHTYIKENIFSPWKRIFINGTIVCPFCTKAYALRKYQATFLYFYDIHHLMNWTSFVWQWNAYENIIFPWKTGQRGNRFLLSVSYRFKNGSVLLDRFFRDKEVFAYLQIYHTFIWFICMIG